jgi:hypothetical protein
MNTQIKKNLLRFIVVGLALIFFFFPTSLFSAGFDDLTTPGINEGKIGSGFDDLNTPGINEGKIGSGFDDLSTPDINEGKW